MATWCAFEVPWGHLYSPTKIGGVHLENRPAGRAFLFPAPFYLVLTREILAALERAIDDFAGPTAQFDDIAILIAKRL